MAPSAPIAAAPSRVALGSGVPNTSSATAKTIAVPSGSRGVSESWFTVSTMRSIVPPCRSTPRLQS
jgi:hypothetical protein